MNTSSMTIKITEPMTMLTDYLITVFLCYWGILLLELSENNLAMDFWAIALIFTGIGAFTGGTFHGFKENFSIITQKIIWSSTIISIGIATLFVVLAGISSSIKEASIRQLSIIFALFFFLLYLYQLTKNPEFITVILYYGPMMLLILVLKVITYYQFNDPSSIEIILAILLAFIGAGIQASGKGLHKHFNHNDIFHIIQIISSWFFFKGAEISPYYGFF